MPFEMTVQEAFTERLPGGAMRVWSRGEEISDPVVVDRLRGNPHVVQRWENDPPPPPEPAPEPAAKTDPKPLPSVGVKGFAPATDLVTDPAPKPVTA